MPTPLSPTLPHRCFGDTADLELLRFHDLEWGISVSNPTQNRRDTPSGLHERELYEALTLAALFGPLTPEATVVKRRELSAAFAEWSPEQVAPLGAALRLKQRSGESVAHNRLCFQEVADEYGGFDQYIWQFTHYNTLGVVGGLLQGSRPIVSPEAEAMAADLARRGFKGLPTPTCYAFMQSIGMLNDHAQGCWLAPQKAVVGIVQGTPLLFLTTLGRKTQRIRTRPLPFQRDGANIALTSSNAGRDFHSAWYLNLQANPNAQIRLDGKNIKVKSRPATAEEKERLWAQKVAKGTSSVGFQTLTTRVFPTVILEPQG